MTTAPTTARSNEAALLAELAQLAAAGTEVTSVALVATSDATDAAELLDVRWRNARSHLETLDAPAERLDALEEAIIAAGHEAGDVVVAYAHESGVWLAGFDDDYNHLTDEWVAAHGVLPRFGFVGDAAGRHIAHVIVRVDRAGADIEVIGDDGDVGTDSVEGQRFHMSRSKPGGWSQRRFQQRAENIWDDNAEAVADAVVAHATEVDAELIVVAGDRRTASLLETHLEGVVAAKVIYIDAGDDDGVAAGVRRQVATVAAERTTDTLAALREGLATGAAVAGVEDTLAALTQGAVAVLIVADDDDDQRSARFGVDPPWCAPAGDSTQPAPGDDVRTGRLADAAVTVAGATSAAVRWVPTSADVEEGIGALLRW